MGSPASHGGQDSQSWRVTSIAGPDEPPSDAAGSVLSLTAANTPRAKSPAANQPLIPPRDRFANAMSLPSPMSFLECRIGGQPRLSARRQSRDFLGSERSTGSVRFLEHLFNGPACGQHFAVCHWGAHDHEPDRRRRRRRGRDRDCARIEEVSDRRVS